MNSNLIQTLIHSSSQLILYWKMFQNSSHIIFLAQIVLEFFTFSIISQEILPKFCDVNYIDAVLWDGYNYRLTRDEWIAHYDRETRAVDIFINKVIDGLLIMKSCICKMIYNVWHVYALMSLMMYVQIRSALRWAKFKQNGMKQI